MNYGKIWIDGHFIEYESASIGLMSHSLGYASSVYEGIRSYNGEPFKLKAHLMRLKLSCRIFGHTLSFADEELIEVCQQLLKINQLCDAYIKIQVFFDDSGSGYLGMECRTRVAIIVHDCPAFSRSKDWRVKTASWRRPSKHCHPYEAKTSATYALSFLAARARAVDTEDILFLDERGYVCEAAAANIFFVRGKTLYTSTTETCLDGITRKLIIEEIAPSLELDVCVGNIHADGLSSFDDAFLCGTALEIKQVGQLDDHHYVGSSHIEAISNAYQRMVGKMKVSKAD